MKHSADMLIIGAGPVGLYAAYYAGFRGFSTIVCDTLPEIGGQISAMYPEKLIFDVAGSRPYADATWWKDWLPRLRPTDRPTCWANRP